LLLSLTDLSGENTSPVLLSVRDFVLNNQQIAWWDHGNGYTAPWTQFIGTADSPAAGPQSFGSHWQKQWGDAAVKNCLSENGDVRLAAKLPHRFKLEPRDFALLSNCPAASAGPNQTALGVDFEHWSASPQSSSRATSFPTTTTGPAKISGKKTDPQPTNKNSKSTKPNF